MEEQPRSIGTAAPGSPQPARTEGSACPGRREAPAPGRGRRCPVAWGVRAVRAGRLRDGRVTCPRRQRWRRPFAYAGLSGRGRSSSGRAAPLIWERRPGTASARDDRGRRLPRAARSASPGEGQALPARFGRPGSAGENGTRRQGRWPLPTERGVIPGLALWGPARCVRARTLLRWRRVERKRPIFRRMSGPAHAEAPPPGPPQRARQKAPPARGGCGRHRSAAAGSTAPADRRRASSLRHDASRDRTRAADRSRRAPPKR